ncbi:hypothetical protein FN846DRAFT_893250 [Sphaerosporella brunnea]|uniref:Uncharacterized protein n=1 Tax=Sphaerosporella brunnea TaxID=1250544 RepID=A0A5J5EN13_9PEZI|nr:hypothetical protein FN846DRAFT_893250 [Sphaerosporella brunnea]
MDLLVLFVLLCVLLAVHACVAAVGFASTASMIDVKVGVDTDYKHAVAEHGDVSSEGQDDQTGQSIHLHAVVDESGATCEWSSESRVQRTTVSMRRFCGPNARLQRQGLDSGVREGFVRVTLTTNIHAACFSTPAAEIVARQSHQDVCPTLLQVPPGCIHLEVAPELARGSNVAPEAAPSLQTAPQTVFPVPDAEISSHLEAPYSCDAMPFRSIENACSTYPALSAPASGMTFPARCAVENATVADSINLTLADIADTLMATPGIKQLTREDVWRAIVANPRMLEVALIASEKEDPPAGEDGIRAFVGCSRHR